MKRLTLWIFVIMIATGLFAAEGLAKSKKIKDTIRLKDLETLYLISQDLDENTAVFIKPDQGCFCSCRDNLWSCTDLLCKKHYQECENTSGREDSARMRTQPSQYGNESFN